MGIKDFLAYADQERLVPTWRDRRGHTGNERLRGGCRQIRLGAARGWEAPRPPSGGQQGLRKCRASLSGDYASGSGSSFPEVSTQRPARM